MAERTAPDFSVISGRQVQAVLENREARMIELVEQTYRMHGAGETVNPPSYFLTYPDRPRDRIIALPAALSSSTQSVSGIKWISSFPDNTEFGLPRASAVTILNDADTGYPFACLESSIISATRTAASAALGARVLTAGREAPRTLGIVGTGLIARYIFRFLTASGWDFDEVLIHDLHQPSAESFRSMLESLGVHVRVVDTDEELVRSSRLMVFATIADSPHILNAEWFDHHPVVLHVSLRDLGPDVIMGAQNIVDDVEHCLKANTSVHLVEQHLGHRDFIDGTIADVLTGKLVPEADRTIIFSPFGLGVLDLALAAGIHSELYQQGNLVTVPNFFEELSRHGRLAGSEPSNSELLISGGARYGDR